MGVGFWVRLQTCIASRAVHGESLGCTDMARLMERQEAEMLQVTRLLTDRMRHVTSDNLTLVVCFSVFQSIHRFLKVFAASRFMIRI